MNKSEFEAKRKEILANAQKKIDEGNTDEANKLMDSIKELEEEFDK